MSGKHFETIVYEKSGSVARLTMNRPDRLNGMTNRMLVETRDALFLQEGDGLGVGLRHERDEHVRAVGLAAAGAEDVVDGALDDGYRAMASDKTREAEATDWCNALAGDMADEAR